MKKNRMMRTASVLLVAVLLSTCAISGTFAKYTSTHTATDTVTVAKWDVKVDDAAFSDTATFDFTETWTDSDGNVEDDVADNKLAPGTKGSFDLTVTNSSEVNAQFKVNFDFAALNAIPLNFTFKIDGADYTQGDFVEIAMNASKVITVTWEWPFEAVGSNTNAADTALGEAGTTFNVSATIVAEQVD